MTGQRKNRDVSAQNAAQRTSAGSFCTCGAWRGQLGLEPTPQLFVSHLVEVFREVWRVLRSDGTLWLNLGDTYAQDTKWGGVSGEKNYTSAAGGYAACRNLRTDSGLRRKNLVGVPWRVALALQDDGWILRSEIIWHKVNGMPEPVTDRPTRAHEQIFLLAKEPKYFYDADAIREPLKPKTFTAFGAKHKPQGNDSAGSVKSANWAASVETRKPKTNGAGEILGANKRSVWTVPCGNYDGEHYAAYPADLIRPCILAGTSERGVCSACGAPYTRIVERDSKSAPVEERKGRVGHNGQPPQQSGWFWTPPEVRSVGWKPGCSCDAGEPVPATVLDPFGGSVVTARVAIEHGRQAILIEINEKYLELAERRAQTSVRLNFS